MTEQKNISKLIQALGGSSVVGRALGIAPQSVSQWMRDDRRVPFEKVVDLIRLGRKHGIDVVPEQLRPDVEWALLRGESK